MKPMTARQLTSICRIFTDGDNIAPAGQIQDLLDSGCLADLRDANFSRMDPHEFRNRIREVCGLPPLNAKGQVDHIVNGKKPFVANGWKVEFHQKTGNQKLTRDGDNLFLDGKKIELHLSPNQAEGKSIKSDKLRKELEKVPVLTACHLDYLREHPDLIPESWKVDEKGRTRYIFFWGTIYRYDAGRLYVRCLFWYDGQWHWNHHWLGDEWRVINPAAVLAA